jgi:protein-S-isoprenylcysteine O-methyltransferase Ste14
MLLRALVAFLALPGVVAFVLPAWIGVSGGQGAGHAIPAAALLTPGTALLIWCVREFYVAGRGTLAPWDPPQHLVTSGPYRLSRNPMYLGVVLILAGWCTLWSSRALIIYTALIMIGFHMRVLLTEEPWARRRFGAEWDAYRARVPRWVI